MHRRALLTTAFAGAAATLAPGLVVGGRTDGRLKLVQAMARSRLEIRRIGAHYKASGWTDEGLKLQLAAEGRVFAGHHRALTNLQQAA